MKYKHTPGPWTFQRVGVSEYAVVSNEVRSPVARRVYAEADAARIVACVNAMEGIDDPNAARALVDDPRTAAATDMLEALRLASSVKILNNPMFGDVRRAVDSAIAKAEGKKS